MELGKRSRDVRACAGRSSGSRACRATRCPTTHASQARRPSDIREDRSRIPLRGSLGVAPSSLLAPNIGPGHQHRQADSMGVPIGQWQTVVAARSSPGTTTSTKQARILVSRSSTIRRILHAVSHQGHCRPRRRAKQRRPVQHVVSPCVGTMPLWGTSAKSLGARARGHFAFTYCEPMSFQLKVRDVVQADSVTKARGRVAFGTAACAVESP